MCENSYSDVGKKLKVKIDCIKNRIKTLKEKTTLTVQDVQELKSLKKEIIDLKYSAIKEYAKTGVSNKSLAKSFGYSEGRISQILRIPD